MKKHVETVLTGLPFGLMDVLRVPELLWNSTGCALFGRAWHLPIRRDVLLASWRWLLHRSTNPMSHWFTAETNRQIPNGICGLESENCAASDGTLPFSGAAYFANRGLTQATAISTILSFSRLRLRMPTAYDRSENVACENTLAKLHFRHKGYICEERVTEDSRKSTGAAGMLRSEWCAFREKVLKVATDSNSVSFKPKYWRH